MPSVDSDGNQPDIYCITGSATIAFIDSGLPSGTSWSVTVTGVGTKSSTSYKISFIVQMDTTYHYSVSSELGSVPSPSSGSVYSGPQCNIADVYITYSAPYTLTFLENSNFQLPSGTQWSATFNGKTQSTTGTSTQFGAFDGTWSYSVGAYPNYTQSPLSGSVAINGGSKTIQVNFTADAVFNETGLPNGTDWSVDISKVQNQSSTSKAMYIPMDSGVYSYKVSSSNSEYVAVPVTGQFEMQRNEPVSIPTDFVNNSSMVGTIKGLLSYFEPNWNYSSANVQSFAYVVNITAGYFNSSASGVAVLNNTTYSFTFQKTELNSTTVANEYSIITLINSTRAYLNTSEYDESWNNLTTLNDTLVSMTENNSSQLTTMSTLDYANSSIKSRVYEVGSTNGTVFDNSTSHSNSSSTFYLNATATVVSTGVVNFSFTQDLKASSMSGYLVCTDPGDEVVFTTGIVGGSVPNGTTTETFSTAVSNDNGTLNANGNVTNYTIDTASYREKFWWGYAEMAVANVTLPYAAKGTIQLLAAVFTWSAGIVLTLLLKSAAGVSALVAGSIAAGLTLAVALVGFDYTYQMSQHETTNHNYVLYTEGGYTWSWIIGSNFNDPYAESGFYSDGYTNSNGVYVQNPSDAWYYYPFWNLYEGNFAQSLETTHQSPYPPLDSGWTAW